MRFKPQKHRALIQFSLFIFFIFSSFYLLTKLPIRINLTSSVKQGIYRLEEPENLKKGDYIALCLSQTFSNEIYKKGYIKKGHDCHEKYEALLKKIIAEPNDEIEVGQDFIRINRFQMHLKKKFTDHNNQSIPKIAYKNKFKLKGYWVMGDNHPDSFDSRYFGEISETQILYKVTPWVLF